MCDMDVIRSIAPSLDLRVFAWLSVPLNLAIRNFGPKYLGGCGVWKKAKQEVAETGGDLLKVAARVSRIFPLACDTLHKIFLPFN